MLSKQMHSLLSCLPRNHAGISYNDLAEKCSLSKEELQECLVEVDFMEKPYYRRTPNTVWQNSDFYISEIGLAEVEAYEQLQKNDSLVKISLAVATVAMIASIASAVAAFLALCA